MSFFCFGLNKSTRNLFTKRKENLRFGVPYDPSNPNKNIEITADKIKLLEIGNLCANCYPCLHNCSITFVNGRQKDCTLDSTEIEKLIKELDTDQVVNPYSDKKHFSTPNPNTPRNVSHI